MVDIAERYGARFDLPTPPVGQTPEQRISWVTEQLDVNGRTPMQWVRWAEALEVSTAARKVTASADLLDGVARIYDGVGIELTTEARADMASQAARMSAPVRAAFADLVGTVADVYPAQAALAEVIVARVDGGFDPHNPFMKQAEREAMLSHQALIVQAIARFRARTAAAWQPGVAATTTPIFADPEGLVILGGTGANTYTRSGTILDPVLLVEPAGSDTYQNSAGGACPVTIQQLSGRWMDCNLLAVSVVADIGDDVTAASDDVYTYNGAPAPIQGAGGPGGLGILVDVAGDDSYYAKMTRGSINSMFQYFDGGAQGFGYSGAGLLLDAVGNDTQRFEVYSSQGRSIWALGQGFGGGGGIGISSNASGSDNWLSYGLGQGMERGGAFQGVYTGGVGFYGGIGIATDTGLGSDNWHSAVTASSVDYYAQGFGAFGGLGILYEDGGDDRYYSFEEATSFNPVINPLLNCAFGTASFGGVGVMIELGGNDTYYGESKGKRGVYVMDFGFGGPGIAYGVFTDTGGNDSYTMVGNGSPKFIEGYGFLEPGIGDLVNYPLGHNTFGAFADIGGTDSYIGGGRGANNQVWAFGVDRGA